MIKDKRCVDHVESPHVTMPKHQCGKGELGESNAGVPCVRSM